jgi:RIO-like serine/threonine protein kinase
MKLDNIIAVRPNKTIYRDGDKCIKVFNEDFSKADVLNEALNQARMETLGLNIPKINAVTMIDGKWAIVSDYIEGETLSQLIARDPENSKKYVEIMVDVQMHIHTKVCRELTRLKDKMYRKLGECGLDENTTYDLRTRLEGMPKHRKLLHGDLCPSNIIITKDGTPYVIDWAHATRGNASADVARSYLTFFLRGEKDNAEYYLDLFCKKSGTDKRYVQSWMPIVAASQLVKGKAEERDFLLSWTQVIDWQ